jgi:hypothetical protein
MDLNDYWQENKRFVNGVAGGAIVFLVAHLFVSGSFDDDIRVKQGEINKRKRDLSEAMFTSSDLADARAENDVLQAAVTELREATHFVPRADFTLASDRGAPNVQYLRAVSSVRDDLLVRANRANLTLESALGMPALSPTREEEIVRYLEALDVVETVVDLAIDSRVQRVERVRVRLDPGLDSREGLGEVERTRVSFTITGTSLALSRLLIWTQRPPGTGEGRVLHVDEVELLPSSSKEDEVRLDLTLVIPRLPDDGEES